MTKFQLIADSIYPSGKSRTVIKSSLRDFGEVKRQSMRTWFLKVLIIACFLVLTAVLFRIQIFEGEYFRFLAEGNRIKEVDLPPPRGIIYDRNGQALVINLPAFRFFDCKDGRENCSVKTVSKEQAIDLEVSGLKSGQTLAVDSARSYPFGLATAHVLGYVSQAGTEDIKSDSNIHAGDLVGKGGIEEKYNSILMGKHGRELIEIDALGKKMRTLSSQVPVAGENVKLTIDLELQKKAFEALQGQKGAVVATDPKNGEVLAIASSPAFDPNAFTDLNADNADRKRQILQIFSDPAQPLFDRATSGTYPAGSTFKIVTAAAGLESGKITQRFTIDDPGVLIIGPYRFPNWKFLQNGGTQGVLNVVSALKVSNDIFFYRVGEALGVDGLSDWALKFGLAKKTGIDLPGEAAGTFPTKKWREKFAREWYLGDTYHLAIGQGDMLATPLQTNGWTSVIANGGLLCRPHVLSNLSNLSDLCKPVGLHKKTLDLIKEGMVEACSPGGTAYPLFGFTVHSSQFTENQKTTVNGEPASTVNRQIQIACKTGTAEFGEGTNKTHAWLTAFAPSDDPTIAVTVIVEGGGEGSDVAAPVVKKVLESWFGR